MAGAKGGGHGGLVRGVDLESVAYAGHGDFDGLAVFGRKSAVGGGRIEEVDNGESEALFRFLGSCRLGCWC